MVIWEKNKVNELENNFNYYKTYEKRNKQVYENGYLWSTNNRSLDVIETIVNSGITTDRKILEIGCGKSRDAISLLNKKYNVMAIDYSNTVIEKFKQLSNYKYNNRFK